MLHIKLSTIHFRRDSAHEEQGSHSHKSFRLCQPCHVRVRRLRDRSQMATRVRLRGIAAACRNRDERCRSSERLPQAVCAAAAEVRTWVCVRTSAHRRPAPPHSPRCRPRKRFRRASVSDLLPISSHEGLISNEMCCCIRVSRIFPMSPVPSQPRVID